MFRLCPAGAGSCGGSVRTLGVFDGRRGGHSTRDSTPADRISHCRCKDGGPGLTREEAACYKPVFVLQTLLPCCHQQTCTRQPHRVSGIRPSTSKVTGLCAVCTIFLSSRQSPAFSASSRFLLPALVTARHSSIGTDTFVYRG